MPKVTKDQGSQVNQDHILVESIVTTIENHYENKLQNLSKQITDVLSRPSIKQIKNLLNFANKKRPHLETEFDQLLSKIEGVNSELKKFAKKSSSTQNIKDLYQSYKRESEKLDEENDCVVCLEDLGG